MAGTILLQRKARWSPEKFTTTKLAIRKYIKDKFPANYLRIEYHEPDEHCFIVEFRKDNRKKFYQDKNGNWLFFEGWVFALDQIAIHDAESLFKLYKKAGRDFCKNLDGQFVIKIFDADKKTTLIINDYLKNHTNFFMETENGFFFSTFSIFSAFLKPPELDQHAFNEYMWRYYIMSERSMLKDVKRLQASSIYAIQNEKMERTRYWQWPQQYTELKFDQAVEKLSESFKDSARLLEMSGTKPIVELTMGQDSRTIASAFTNQMIPFDTAIYGKNEFHEVKHVKEMTRRHGFINHHVKLQNSFTETPWDAVKEDIILSSSEYPGYLIGRIMHMRRQYLPFSSMAVNGVHGRFYKDGTWNEMYLMNLYREPKTFRSDIFIKYRALNKNYRYDIFNEQIQKIKENSHDYYKTMINESIAGLEHSPIALQVDKFDGEHYAAFGQAGNTACNQALDLMSPLLYRRNLEFAVTLPAKWRYNLSKIQRGVVHRLDPALAAEKTDFGGLNMTPPSMLTTPLFLSRYWYAQSKKFRDKLKNLAGLNVKTQLQKAWDYLPVYQNLFFNPEVQDILHSKNMAMSENIDSLAWENMMNEYADHSYHSLERLEYILKILTVEYFLKEAKSIKSV